MTTHVDIVLSIASAVQDVLQNEALWTAPFTIYSVSDMTSSEDEPNHPFLVFDASGKVIPPMWQPFLALGVDVRGEVLQMGSTDAVAEIEMALFTRYKGQGHAISYNLIRNLANFNLYNWADRDNPELIKSVSLDPWDVRQINPSPLVLKEATVEYVFAMTSQAEIYL